MDDAALAYRPVLAEARLRAFELEGRLDFAGKELAARNREFSDLEARCTTLENELKDADRVRKQLVSIRGPDELAGDEAARAANAWVRRRARRRR